SPPKFHGTAGEDPADYIRDLCQWCEAFPNHDLNAGHQHQIRIDGLFESGLLDYAKDWYETEIKGRNWELQNISDNTGLANTSAGGNTIAPGMFIGQKIYTFLHDFPTITAEKSKVKFQNLVQGNDPVEHFYANLKRIVKLAYPLLPTINQDETVKQQFFQGL